MSDVATPQEIIDQSECLFCLPVSIYEGLTLGILNSFMPAVDTDTLMDEAKCYLCYGPISQSQMLTLAQLRRWLLTLAPTADVTPQALIEYSKCYACLGSLSMFELMMLALLDQIAQAS